MSLQRVPQLSRFEESPLRAMLVEHMREVAVGELISYADLSDIAGENIHDAWHLVASARDALLREGMVFDVVRTVGLKRLDDDGKVAASEGYLDKVKHAARRSTRLLRATDFGALSEAARSRYLVAEIRAGAVLQFSSQRATGKLLVAVEKGDEPRQWKAAVADVISQFGG